MSKDVLVLICIWVTSLILIVFIIPRKKYSEAIFTFLAGQPFFWLGALLLMHWGLIRSPVREFPKATDLLFTVDYYLNPLLCMLYVLFEPQAHRTIRFFYFALWISLLTIIDVALERYTDLVHFIHYAWYWDVLYFSVIVVTIRTIHHWFFQLETLQSGRRTVR